MPAGQGGAVRLAARKSCGVFLAGKAEFFEQIQRPVATIGRRGAKTRLDIGQGGGEAGQIRFLRQIVDCGAGLGEAISRIGLHQPGRNAQQGRLAGAVAPDQADPVAGRNGQLRAGKQGRNPKGDTDVL
jgi:hypothetical protein